jgi:hypothetical protein
METLYAISHYALSLVISIALVYFTAIIAERPIELQLLGRDSFGHFLSAFFRRVWIYWLLPGIFSFTGIGLVLFPNSKVQDALAKITPAMLDKEGPYSENIASVLGLTGEGGTAVIGAVIASILLIAVARIIIVTYNPSISTTIYFYFLGSMGIIGLMMTLSISETYVRLLVDYILGDKFQAGLILVAVGSGVGLLTELLLSRHPIIGMSPGQRPGQGTYVCKTCQRSQYLNGNSELERCAGQCTQPVFRKAN